MASFTKEEKILLKKINTPSKVQDFLNTLSFNFEKKGETLHSPVETLRAKSAHCLEGALLGAYILSLHGFKPYILHLRATKEDYDHAVVPFKIGHFWGAISKTNHSVLRYREPIYKSIRELVMSYFHEYFLNDGRKTLRQYSKLLNLNSLQKDWFLEDDVWFIDHKLDEIKHYDIIINKSSLKNLRKADNIEIQTGKIVEYKK